MEQRNLSGVDQASIFDELFGNEVVYAVNKDFKIVFASKGAKDFYQMITKTKDDPLGKICYNAFKLRESKCKTCLMNFFCNPENKDIVILQDSESEIPNIRIAYKQYNNNGEAYLIHHLIKYELSDWMEKYSQEIIYNSKESIVVTDLNGIIIDVNPTFEQKMGYKKEDVRNQPNKIFYLYESEAAQVTNEIKEKKRIENYRTKVKTKGSYFFRWDEIPGNDNGRLKVFLKQNLGIDWVETAKIEKIDDGKTIKVSTKKNFLTLKLNNEKTRVNLEIDERKADELIVMAENGKLNIYQGGKQRDIELTAWITKKGNQQVIVRVSKFLEKAEVLKSVIAITTENILKEAYEPGKLTYFIVNETAKLLESQFCCLYLVSKDKNELVMVSANDQNYLEKAKDITYKLNWNAKTDAEIDGITSWVAIRKSSFEANSWSEVLKHPSHKGKLDKIYSLSAIKFKNMYAVPLIIDTQVKGVFRIENKIYGDSFNPMDKEIFELMGKYIILVLEEQTRLKKTVLEHIAHLTRSPIAEAVMNLSLLDSYNFTRLSRFEIDETIRIIKNALLQANMTVTNLIVLSTESKGIYSAPVRLVDMKGFVKKITHSFEAYIKNIRFNINVSGSILLSISDQIKLEIILQNIIHNSIKYSKHKKHTEDIDINDKMNGNFYTIRVRDYGVGMSRDDLNIIFNEFTKGESSKVDREKFGSVRGLGIGLSSIKKICNEMNWKPDIKSELGRGTTFTLTIPL